MGISPQNAQNYIAYYRFSQIYGADVAKLFLPSVVYRLASSPESVTLLLMKRAKAGERITVLDVRQAVYDADQPQRGAPIGAGDDQAKYASDHSGGHKEGDGGTIPTPMCNWTRKSTHLTIAHTSSPISPRN